MTRFEKISKEQFVKDCGDQINYENVALPKRATKGSAGYDFFSLTSFTLAPGEHIKIPTGIRVVLPDDKFLMVVPRSSLGFKFRLQLDNTVGIIDSDYSHSDNEGHIWMKITNDTVEGKTLHINVGDAIAQGIILSFGKTDDDEVKRERNGGFGSTTQ